MKQLIALFLLLLPAWAMAQNCDVLVSNIEDESTKNAMLASCLKSQQSAVSDVVTNPDKLNELAKSYSTAIGSMASELGVAVNEFAKSDVGSLLTWMLIYKVYGEDIKGFIFSPIIVAIALWAWGQGGTVILGRNENGKLNAFADASEDACIVYVIFSAILLIFCGVVLCEGLL